MRLNDRISESDAPVATEAQLLLKNTLGTITRSLSSDLNLALASEKISAETREFFEKFYTKPDFIGKADGVSLSIGLSSIEAEIVNFFLGNSSLHQLYLLVDHAGRGKSTILKYLTYYLIQQEPELRNRITPLYISLRDYEVVIAGYDRASDLYNLLDETLKEKSFDLVRKYLIENHKVVFKWINSQYPSSLQGLYPDSKIDQIVDIEDHLSQLAEHNKSDLVTLIVGSLCHLSATRPVVLFLDDADNFGIDEQRALIRYAGMKLTMGLKVLVSLRHSSWEAIEVSRRDFEPKISTHISWSFSQIKHLLEKRLTASRSVRLDATFIMEQYDIEPAALVRSFVNLLENSNTYNFLIKTSNFNLHSLMRKLSLITKSWHFNDQYLLREEMIERFTERKKHGIPLWVIYKLIMGSYLGTYKSTPDLASCGLLNCFCTFGDKQNAYTFFIRLLILSRLRNHIGEADSVRLVEIYEECTMIFGSIFGFTDVFRRTIFKLIQSGLILTMSFRRYSLIDEVTEHIKEEKVFMSEAGRYYLDDFFKRIEYLYFVKDDIDWPEKCKLDGLTFAGIEDGPTKMHKQTLRALSKLLSFELQMIEGIKEELRSPGDGAIVNLYISKYSASKLSLDKRNVLFTMVMYEKYCEYFSMFYKKSVFEEVLHAEIESIENKLSDYKDVIASFSA